MPDKIKRIETYCVKLPYRGTIQFASAEDTGGPYVVLRITTEDGVEGIAECIARPQQFQGEDTRMIAYELDTFFRPMLEGADPLEHGKILAGLARIKHCRAAKAMIDLALWDIKGKLLGQPVWRLLGGSPGKTVPLSTIVFGDTAKDMVEDAVKTTKEQGIRGFKIKVWKRSMEDVAVIRDIRKAVGDEAFLYADSNGVYGEGEARRIFPHFADSNVRFIEDPCKFNDPEQLAKVAAVLPMPVLGDSPCESLEAVYALVKAGAIGAVSIKLRRTGLTESIKLVGLCEAAGIPAVIGTDTESRVGAQARLHLWAAFRSLQAIPAETGFFRHLADDLFTGDFEFKNGAVSVSDAPGFGAALDEKKLKKYLV